MSKESHAGTEEEILKYETARTKAMEEFFNARKFFFYRTEGQERAFDGGFRMAWKLLKDNNENNR